MDFMIPSSITHEHKNLHAGLHKAIRSGGNIGKAAEDVLEVLHEHFDKEEKYALPPLSLLSLLACDKISLDMKDILPITEKLKTELPVMLEEHKKIVSALNHLIEIARQENRQEPVEFAEALLWHTKTEEELLYPAAILIGEYLKLKI
ncbi:MAG: hypothetical protein ACREBB_00310 [Nitrosotalea sp.]